MERKLWICWEDRCLMWDEIDEDLLIDTMIDIYYEEDPDFDLDYECSSLEFFMGSMSAEKFEEIKQKAIEKIESRFEYFEI